jgi:hypothetical protein
MNSNLRFWLPCNLVLILAFMGWLVLWIRRKRIIRWICKRMIARNQRGSAETVLKEARSEHWIDFTGESDLRLELGLPMDVTSPASADPKPGLAEHLKDTIRFYLPGAFPDKETSHDRPDGPNQPS